MKFSKWTFFQYIITRGARWIMCKRLAGTLAEAKPACPDVPAAEACFIDIRLPGHETVTLERNATTVILTREEIST